MRKLLVLLFAAVVAVSFTAMNAAAQVETGRIVGVVSDPTGAVIPGAKCTVRSTSTGAERTQNTDEQGGYAFANLLPGIWELSVEATGFAKWTRRVQVTVGSKVVVDPQLSVGAAVTVVEVAGEAGVQVNVSQQLIEQVIDSKKIVDLPTFNRNPYNLVSTSANVSTTDPTGRGAGVAINGLRASSTNILLDGASNNDEFRAAVGQSVPLDSVQEFSVITNNFSAEYGRAAAGVVNVATKSGTNEYHGSAFWYGRYSTLSSNSWQDNAFDIPRAVFTRNQFGYTIGGPVTPGLKDKLLFFNSTEWTRIRSSANIIRVIPRANFVALTNAATQAFFNTFGTLKSGITILDSLSRQDLAAGGVAGGSGDPCGSTTGSFFAACNAAIPFATDIYDQIQYSVPSNSGGGDPVNEYQIVGRVDYNWNAKTTVYTRYALQRQDFLQGTVSHSPYVGFDTGEKNFYNNILTSLLRTWTPRLTTQTKIVYNRLNNVDPLNGPPSPTLYWKEGTAQRINNRLAPLPGYLPTSPGSGIPFGGPQNFAQFFQDGSYSWGKHQWRFGGSYVYIQDNRTFGAYQTPTASLSTNNLPQATVNFLNGQLLRFQSAIDPQGKFPCSDRNGDGVVAATAIAGVSGATVTDPDIDPTCLLTLPVVQPSFSRSNRYHEFAMYANDSIKVTRTFTLNLGVRWEYFGVQHNKDPLKDSNFYDGSGGNAFIRIRNGSLFTVPDSPIKGLWRKDFNNFGPRLGFGWDLFGNGKTSLRGGWGISYERNFGNVTFNVIQNPPNYAVIAIINGVDIPTLPIPLTVEGPLAGSSGQKPLPTTSTRNVDSNIQTAYAQFWSLTVEHEIVPKVVVGVDYNGSKGHGLYSLEDPNRVGSGNLYLGNPCVAIARDAMGNFTGVTTFPFGSTTAGGTPRCTNRINLQYSNLNRRGQKAYSNHNALAVRVNMNNPWNSGLTVSANYTWGHTFDNLSSTFSESGNNFNLGLLDPFNPKLDYGQADFDLRHRMVISAIWDIPFAKNTTGWLNRVAHGWKISPIFTARTGAPFTVYDCSLAFFQVCPRMFAEGTVTRSGSRGVATGTGQFEYIDLTGQFDNDDFTHPIFGPTSYFNPLTMTGEYGPFPVEMTPRNLFRGPNVWDVDLGIYKDTKITERWTVQLRAEMFNVFNHANDFVDGGSTDVSSASNVIVLPSGRRNVQFTLKLIF
jgi:hypothetical protein